MLIKVLSYLTIDNCLTLEFLLLYRFISFSLTTKYICFVKLTFYYMQTNLLLFSSLIH